MDSHTSHIYIYLGYTAYTAFHNITNDIFNMERLGTILSEILIKIQNFRFKNLRLQMSTAKLRTFSLGLNVLMFRHISSISILPK